jgi:hypothetical protein
MEDRDLPPDREDREDASHERRRRSRHADDPPPIESIRSDAPKDPAEETWREAGQTDEAKIERPELRSSVTNRELHCEHADSEPLHPSGLRRKHETGKEDPEVVVTQGSKRVNGSCRRQWRTGGCHLQNLVRTLTRIQYISDAAVTDALYDAQGWR